MTNKTLTLGSLFDGSGGFPLGGLLAGITPVWASEIEPFPIRVTTKRLPFMKHYGNISAMDGGRIEPVDIITFGSPCQDMSVAGRRDGLDGERSSLFYEAVRIIKEMRCATGGRYPRYIVWENVPGAFSSNRGEDFKAVLEAVIGIAEPEAEVPMPEKARWPYADLYMGDGWSVAYRTLDAQYWGVPQRRRRIYLVADLAGRSAGKILFESEGLSGYSAEGFRSWQRAAGSFTPCVGTTGFDGYNGSLTEEVSSTLGVNYGMSTGRMLAMLAFLPHREPQNSKFTVISYPFHIPVLYYPEKRGGTTMATLLIVEDDRKTNDAICEYLKPTGHKVIPAYDGGEALQLFCENSIDLVVLDIMLPHVSGLSILHEIRRTSATPILMLTALEDEYTQVRSFDEQADDYMTKPFSMVLLGKRITALLRRSGQAPSPKTMAFGDVTVDFSGYTASDSAGKIDIMPKETDLLRLLVEHKGLVLTRSQILDELWGADYPIIDRTVDTYIKNLRKKLRLDCIVTVKGIGYKYEAQL